MNVLLDTHALLWWLFADRRLSSRAKAGFAELPTTAAHAIRAGNWDVEHRDPSCCSAMTLQRRR